MSTRNKVEITRSDLAETLLQMCKLNIPDVLDYEFMQKPSEQYFIRAFDDLVAIGAIDAKLQEITPHGTKVWQRQKLQWSFPNLQIMKLALECAASRCRVRLRRGNGSHRGTHQRRPRQGLLQASGQGKLICFFFPESSVKRSFIALVQDGRKETT